jgi:hypothetical protein
MVSSHIIIWCLSFFIMLKIKMRKFKKCYFMLRKRIPRGWLIIVIGNLSSYTFILSIFTIVDKRNQLDFCFQQIMIKRFYTRKSTNIERRRIFQFLCVYSNINIISLLHNFTIGMKEFNQYVFGKHVLYWSRHGIWFTNFNKVNDGKASFLMLILCQ